MAPPTDPPKDAEEKRPEQRSPSAGEPPHDEPPQDEDEGSSSRPPSAPPGASPPATLPSESAPLQPPSSSTPRDAMPKPEKKVKISRELENLLTFNAVLENSFPKTPKNRETRRSRADEPLLGRDPAFLMTLNIKVRKIPRSIVTRPNNVGAERIVVFVDPNDDSIEYWAPAMVVPTIEWDSDMKKVRPGEVIVRYFLDSRLAVVLVQDLVLFGEHIEPFLTFAKTSEKFLKDRGVQYAIEHSRTGAVPEGFKWAKWGEADLLEESSGEETPVSKKNRISPRPPVKPLPSSSHKEVPNHHGKGEKEAIQSPRKPSRRSIRQATPASNHFSDQDDQEEEDPTDSSDDELCPLDPIEAENMPSTLSNEKFEKFLFDFMEEQGTPIQKIPILGYEPLDLKRLYDLVTSRGGMDEVTNRQEWRGIYKRMKIANMSTSAAYSIRRNYLRCLYPLEKEHFKPIGRKPGNHPPAFEEESNGSDYMSDSDDDGHFRAARGKPKAKKEKEKEKEKEREKEKEKEKEEKEEGADEDLKGKPPKPLQEGQLFAEEEKVLVFHKPTEKKFLAKVLAYDPSPAADEVSKKAKKEGRYFIHYHGWKSSFDEWVPASYVFSLLDETRKPPKGSKMKGPKVSGSSPPPSSPALSKSTNRQPSEKESPLIETPPKLGSKRGLRSRSEADLTSPESAQKQASTTAEPSGPPRGKRLKKLHHGDEDLDQDYFFDDHELNSAEGSDLDPEPGRRGEKRRAQRRNSLQGNDSEDEHLEEDGSASKRPRRSSRPQRSTRPPSKSKADQDREHSPDQEQAIKMEAPDRDKSGLSSPFTPSLLVKEEPLSSLSPSSSSSTSLLSRRGADAPEAGVKVEVPPEASEEAEKQEPKPPPREREGEQRDVRRNEKEGRDEKKEVGAPRSKENTKLGTREASKEGSRELKAAPGASSHHPLPPRSSKIDREKKGRKEIPEEGSPHKEKDNEKEREKEKEEEKEREREKEEERGKEKEEEKQKEEEEEEEKDEGRGEKKKGKGKEREREKEKKEKEKKERDGEKEPREKPKEKVRGKDKDREREQEKERGLERQREKEGAEEPQRSDREQAETLKKEEQRAKEAEKQEERQAGKEGIKKEEEKEAEKGQEREKKIEREREMEKDKDKGKEMEMEKDKDKDKENEEEKEEEKVNQMEAEMEKESEKDQDKSKEKEKEKEKEKKGKGAGKVVRKPVARALTRVRRNREGRASESEASNDDGNASDASRDEPQKPDNGKTAMDRFKKYLFQQTQAIRQQLPDLNLDLAQLIPGFLDLPCELRAEKIEARMNELKVQYRQHFEELRKHQKLAD